MTQPAVPQAVKSAIAPNVQTSVRILTNPQLEPREYGPFSPVAVRKQVNPKVPRTEVEGSENMRSLPAWSGHKTTGTGRTSGTPGNSAPSVPVNGFLFKSPPIDPHYINEYQGGRNPYRKINNPPTRGMWSRIQAFANHIAQSPQNVDPNGFRTMPLQQRTSYMRNQLPNLGIGYAPEMATPRQLPQRTPIYKYPPALGTDPYGKGVLNSSTFGAGQTAGGIGGNNYTPQPGPPDQNSTAGSSVSNAMPTWG